MDFHFGDTTDTKIIFRKVFGAASVGPGNFDRPHDDFELDMIRISENWWWSSAAIYWSAEAAASLTWNSSCETNFWSIV